MSFNCHPSLAENLLTLNGISVFPLMVTLSPCMTKRCFDIRIGLEQLHNLVT